jgi:drug/metabolite transporter (DMT)-like permease
VNELQGVSRGGWRLPMSLGVIYIVWGSTYLGIRVMVRSIPPLLGAGARFMLAGALLGLLLWVRRRKVDWGVSPLQTMSAAFAGLLILVGGIGLVTVAEQDVPSAFTALVIASIPLWVVLLQLLHQEDVHSQTIAAVMLGFAGLVVLLRPGQGGGPEVGSLLLLLAAALLTAIGTYYSNRMEMPRDLFVATMIEMLVAGAALVLAGLFLGELHEFSIERVSAESLVAFAYLVLIGSLVAYSAFVWLLGNAKVSTVSTYAYVNPVVAVVLGVLLLGEEVSLNMFVGAAVIVLSVMLIVRSEQH